jgi:hypothetical protein
MQLSNFERKFIATMAKPDRQREIILAQLQVATVASRDYTGVGLYTELSVPESAPLLDEARWKIEEMPQCSGEHPDLPAGAGFILWLKAGYISCLESYTYDGSWPTNEDLFRPAV